MIIVVFILRLSFIYEFGALFSTICSDHTHRKRKIVMVEVQGS